MTATKNELVIRPAMMSDIETLKNFNCALAKETEDKQLDSATVSAGIEAVLREPQKGKYWLAEKNGFVVGALLITTEWSDWRNGDLWWIQSVYVRSEARRQGVYRSLYQHVSTLARQNRHVRGIRLYVEQQNCKAQTVYTDMNMKNAGYWVFEDIF